VRTSQRPFHQQIEGASMQSQQVPTNLTLKDKLIAAGVKNLKEFGYPSVNAE
jgi:hypothetical protein